MYRTRFGGAGPTLLAPERSGVPANKAAQQTTTDTRALVRAVFIVQVFAISVFITGPGRLGHGGPASGHRTGFLKRPPAAGRAPTLGLLGFAWQQQTKPAPALRVVRGPD